MKKKKTECVSELHIAQDEGASCRQYYSVKKNHYFKFDKACIVIFCYT